MRFLDFPNIVRAAWADYDSTRTIKAVEDISMRVSTNHVFKITFVDGHYVVAKVSYFGQYQHFLEDHTMINVLSTNLLAPYDILLARSLVKGKELYTYRYQDSLLDAWVVFYNPVRVDQMLPRRLDEAQIDALGAEFARFHLECSRVRHTLPPWSKSIYTDLDQLERLLNTELGQFVHRGYDEQIRRQCERLREHAARIGHDQLEKIPVFVDWNIGNFSVTEDYRLFSRWDYDWFRLGSRMLDFYFLSRIVSDIGDRTVFSYNLSTLTEARFLRFLRAYHAVYPLTEAEIRFLPEAYRFFILNYVVKDGRYFFHEVYASKLQQEAFTQYFPSLEEADVAEVVLKGLGV